MGNGQIITKITVSTIDNITVNCVAFFKHTLSCSIESSYCGVVSVSTSSSMSCHNFVLVTSKSKSLGHKRDMTIVTIPEEKREMLSKTKTLWLGKQAFICIAFWTIENSNYTFQHERKKEILPTVQCHNTTFAHPSSSFPSQLPHHL